MSRSILCCIITVVSVLLLSVSELFFPVLLCIMIVFNIGLHWIIDTLVHKKKGRDVNE